MISRTPLDDVEFLARSGHRVDVLRTLASGARTRRVLHEETGISQPTLGRILGDFEDRRWVERRRREYALTAFGALVGEEFESLLDTVETVQRLGDVLHHLPTDEMDFDVREFADATVTTPTPGDAFCHVRRIEELLYGADTVRNVAPSISPGTSEDFEQRWAAFFAGDQRVEAVVSTAALNGVLDQELAHFFREALDLERVQLYLYDGPIPLMLAVADGTALLAPVDEHGTPTAAIESDDVRVRSWVDARLDAYRDASERVTAAQLRG